MSDMRGWIKELEEAGELLRIKKPVNLKTEMGALIWEAHDRQKKNGLSDAYGDPSMELIPKI